MNLLCTIFAIACTSGTVTGPAYVGDGDTLYIARQGFRLSGIDAEELDEPNGYPARRQLVQLIGNQPVTCKWAGWSYRRKVAVCFAGGVNLNAAMVSSGFALDCAHYSNGLYATLEPKGARQRLQSKPYCKG